MRSRLGITVVATAMHRRTIARRGGVYFAVIGACLIVAVIAMGALMAARLQGHGAATGGDADEARLYARAGIELGVLFANQSGFRQNYSNGTWVPSQAVGGGTF